MLKITSKKLLCLVMALSLVTGMGTMNVSAKKKIVNTKKIELVEGKSYKIKNCKGCSFSVSNKKVAKVTKKGKIITKKKGKCIVKVFKKKKLVKKVVVKVKEKNVINKVDNTDSPSIDSANADPQSVDSAGTNTDSSKPQSSMLCIDFVRCYTRYIVTKVETLEDGSICIHAEHDGFTQNQQNIRVWVIDIDNGRVDDIVEGTEINLAWDSRDIKVASDGAAEMTVPLKNISINNKK